VKLTSPKGYFPADNFGDKIVNVTGKDGRAKHVNNRRATQYAPTINAFKNRHWESILNTVRDILGEDGNKRKRSKSVSSRASSEFDLERLTPMRTTFLYLMMIRSLFMINNGICAYYNRKYEIKTS